MRELSNIEVGDLVARISFDDTGLNKAMAVIERQMKLVQAEFGRASSALKGYGKTEEELKTKSAALNQQMQLQQQRVNKLNEAFQASVKEKGEDDAATQRLAVQLSNAQAKYNNLDAELRQVNKDLEEQRKAAEIANSSWTKLGESMTSAGKKMQDVGKSITEVGKSLSLKVTTPIIALGTLAGKAAIDFESAFAGVRKTVDATEEEFAVLSDGIRGMAKVMPAAATEIALVAENAGQLGIRTDAILGFTEVMIGLGEATTMSSDQAATELARLANITKMNQGDFDRLGSSIVALGNNFATTEGEITSMALRLAGAGSQIGMSEADILGLAAALSSVGIEAEMGGSAMSRVMVRMQVAATTGLGKVQELSEATGLSLRDMQLMAANAGMDFADLAQSLGMTKGELKNVINAGADLQNFAKIAGVSAEQFVDKFGQDAVGALGEFINGLGGAEEAGESAINMLQEMGITEIRLRDSLLRAGNASELFAGSIELSNQAWRENTALTEEVAERYKTTESQMAMFKNQVMDLAIQIGNILLPIIQDIITAITPWIEKFAAMDESSQKVILAIAGIAAAVGPLIVVIGTIISSIGSIVSAFGALSTAIGAAGGASAVFGGALAAITGPVGIAVAAIAGITAALVTLYNKNEAFRAFVDETWDAIVQKLKDAWQAVLDFVMPLVDDMVAFFKEQFGKLQDFWKEHGATILKIIKPAFDLVIGVIKVGMEIIKTVINVAWTLIKGIITTVWEGIKLVVSTAIDLVVGIIKTVMKIFQGDWKGAWETVKNTASNIWGNIERFFKGINLVKIGKDIMQGLINGIKSMANAVADTAKNIANSIGDGIKGFFGIKSPSRLMMSYGQYIGQGLAIGMDKTTSAVARQAAELSAAAVPQIGGVKAPGVSGTSGQVASGGGGPISFEGMFAGANFYVRSDDDIRGVAAELFNMSRTAARGAGA